jgi:hypothetical protein
MATGRQQEGKEDNEFRASGGDETRPIELPEDFSEARYTYRPSGSTDFAIPDVTARLTQNSLVIE